MTGSTKVTDILLKGVTFLGSGKSHLSTMLDH